MTHALHSPIRRAALPAAITIATAIGSSPLCADPVADFYKGRQIEVIISGSTGSTYDLGTRMITRHMSKYIPGQPTFVPKMMFGGGHLVAANHMYNVAPKDGTSIASLGETIPLAPLLNPDQAKFDATKFNWLGNSQVTTSTVFTWHATGVRTLDDAKTREVTTGSTGAGSPSFQVPTMLNNVLGTRFKVITGYKSGDIELAMERGELDARGSATLGRMKSIRADWVKEGKVHLLVQVGMKPDEAFPKVPLLLEFARNEAERQVFRFISLSGLIGRPLAAPPGVPADRLAALRSAFESTMKDRELLAEADKMGYEIEPIGWSEFQEIVSEIAKTPLDTLALVNAANTPGKVFDCPTIVKDTSVCTKK